MHWLMLGCHAVGEAVCTYQNGSLPEPIMFALQLTCLGLCRSTHAAAPFLH